MECSAQIPHVCHPVKRGSCQGTSWKEGEGKKSGQAQAAGEQGSRILYSGLTWLLNSPVLGLYQIDRKQPVIGRGEVRGVLLPAELWHLKHCERGIVIVFICAPTGEPQSSRIQLQRMGHRRKTDCGKGVKKKRQVRV